MSSDDVNGKDLGVQDDPDAYLGGIKPLTDEEAEQRLRDKEESNAQMLADFQRRLQQRTPSQKVRKQTPEEAAAAYAKKLYPSAGRADPEWIMAYKLHLAGIAANQQRERLVDSRRFVIENIFARRCHGVLWGAPNTGKTFLAVSMGAAIAMGRPWMGFRVDKSDVIYIDAEGSDISERLRGFEIEWNDGKPINNFHIIERAQNLLDEKILEELSIHIKMLTAGRKVGLIVLDTMAATMAWCSGPNGALKENDNSDMQRMANLAKELAMRFDCVCMAVHHPTKPNSQGEYDMRGGSSLRGSINYEFKLSQPNRDHQDELNFECMKRRGSGMKRAAVFGIKTKAIAIYNDAERLEQQMMMDDLFSQCAPDEYAPDDHYYVPINSTFESLVYDNLRHPPFSRKEEDEQPEKPAAGRDWICLSEALLEYNAPANIEEALDLLVDKLENVHGMKSDAVRKAKSRMRKKLSEGAGNAYGIIKQGDYFYHSDVWLREKSK
ncbi:AAA family ATPase [Enterobacter hormaechei]